MQTLLVKILIGVLITGGVFAGGYIAGQKNMPQVKVECPACPDVNVPPCPATLGTEFDKIKSKYVTLNLKQEYHNSLNADSAVYASLMRDIRDAIAHEFDERKVKKR